MKLFKNITLFVLPVMLLLMLLRLNAGNNAFISLKFLTDVFAAWDPLEPFRIFGNHLQNSFDELKNLITDLDVGYFESVINSVAIIAKTIILFAELCIAGPLKELLDLMLLLFGLFTGVEFVPDIKTPFDNGYLI